MAEKTAQAEPELVDLFVARDAGDKDPNLLIGINGKNYLLPRGKTSKVPRCVADEYQRSVSARIAADQYVAENSGIREAKKE